MADYPGVFFNFTTSPLAYLYKKHYNINTMDELRLLLQENLNNEFISAILSNPRNKEEAAKVKVRPLLHKGGLVFQIELSAITRRFMRILTVRAHAADFLYLWKI